VHHEVFVFVLGLLEKAHLLKGKYLGIDASTMEANAAMKSTVRRDTGETCQEMLERLAEESGIRTPTRAELIAFDRRRQGEKTSNKDGQSIRDEAARRAKLKRWPHPLPVRDGTNDTHGHNGLFASPSENQPFFNGLLRFVAV